MLRLPGIDMVKINFQEKFAKFSEHWTPKVIAEMNDYQFKLAKVKGEFLWHNHSHTDEVFIVIEGCLKIEFAEQTIELNAGEMYVVPKGVQHKPCLLYTSPSPRDGLLSRMPSSA